MSLKSRISELMYETPTPAHLLCARAELEMSQRKLADALDLTENAIYRMESGDRPIERRTWYSIILLLAKTGAIK